MAAGCVMGGDVLALTNMKRLINFNPDILPKSVIIIPICMSCSFTRLWRNQTQLWRMHPIAVPPAPTPTNPCHLSPRATPDAAWRRGGEAAIRSRDVALRNIVVVSLTQSLLNSNTTRHKTTREVDICTLALRSLLLFIIGFSIFEITSTTTEGIYKTRPPANLTAIAQVRRTTTFPIHHTEKNRKKKEGKGKAHKKGQRCIPP
jgi:hypothetical protein